MFNFLPFFSLKPLPDKSATVEVAGFLITHSVIFLLSVFALYYLMPHFLVQSHDGQNLYYMADKLWKWQASISDISTFVPLQAAGSTVWPLNIYLIPFLWPFKFIDDPSLRIYLISTLASLTIFLASLSFYVSLNIKPLFSVLTAWFTFVAYMLQTVDFMTGTDPIIAIAYVYLFLAAFVKTGSVDRNIQSFIYLSLTILFYSLLVFSHPGWHLIGLPFLLVSATVLIFSAQTHTDKFFKVISICICIAFHYLIGSYESLLLNIEDTARLLLADHFISYNKSPYLAGHLFRSSPSEILWGGVLIVGLVYGDLSRLGVNAATSRWVSFLTRVIYGGAIIGAFFFLYSGFSWSLPKPSYMMLFAYPLAGIFTILGLSVILSPTPLHLISSTKKAILVLFLFTFFAWHIINNSLPLWYWLASIPLVLFTWSLIKCFPRIAIFLFVPILLFGFQRNIAHLIGGGPDIRRDGFERMGLIPSPITELLKGHISLIPGSAFNGYIDDYYVPTTRGRDINEEIIQFWAGNWSSLGSGHKTFAWSVFDLPILSQYSPYIKPLYFYFFSSFLNFPTDVHVVNYISITQPDFKILRLMGLKYLVSNKNLPIGNDVKKVLQWRDLFVYELLDTNLGNFSPVLVMIATSAKETIQLIGQSDFDPKKNVIVHGSPIVNDLVEAKEAKLKFEVGGFRVSAKSTGTSLLVLPIQFSNCFKHMLVDGNSNTKIFRVNLWQTGITFSNNVDISIQHIQWPRATPECQRQDLADSRSLIGLNR
jgi:hypothetical protein